MKRIRRWTVALLVLLTFCYRVEYLRFAPQTTVNTGSYASAMIFLAAVITVLTPSLSRVRVHYQMVLWAAVYLIGRVIVFPDIPLLGGLPTLLLIAELAMLSLAVMIAHRLASALTEFTQAVERVTVPDPERWVLQLQNAGDAIRTEINRSRRYQRPLSVVVIQPGLDTFNVALERIFQEVLRGLVRHYAVVGLGRMLKISLRRTDVVALEDRSKGRFVVLCPETDIRGASALGERIATSSPEELGFSVEWGTALFPDDALTFEDVVRIAVERQQSGNSVVASPVGENSG
jgi:hypothetical protein